MPEAAGPPAAFFLKRQAALSLGLSPPCSDYVTNPAIEESHPDLLQLILISSIFI